jgi:hypothetical protein
MDWGGERTAAVAREEEISTIVNEGDMFPWAGLVLTQRRSIAAFLRPCLDRQGGGRDFSQAESGNGR